MFKNVLEFCGQGPFTPIYKQKVQIISKAIGSKVKSIPSEVDQDQLFHV